MAGYNGRGQSNGTAINPQIIAQRSSHNATFRLGLGEAELNGQSGSRLGISRNQAINIFTDFDPQDIMTDSYAKFLSKVTANQNPDFLEDFNPSLFKSNKTVIDEALNESPEENDKPSIGLGPNLLAPDINAVIRGNVPVADNKVTSSLPGKRGFGVFDDRDKNLTMGSYFKNRYTITEINAPITVVKGERFSEPEDLYDYEQ